MGLSYAEAMKKKQADLPPPPRVSSTMETAVALSVSSQAHPIRNTKGSVSRPALSSSAWRTVRSAAPTNESVTCNTTPAAALPSRPSVVAIVARNIATTSSVKSPLHVMSKQGNYVPPWRVATAAATASSRPKNPLPDTSPSPEQSKPGLQPTPKQPKKCSKPKPHKSFSIGDMVGTKILGNAKQGSGPAQGPMDSAMALPPNQNPFEPRAYPPHLQRRRLSHQSRLHHARRNPKSHPRETRINSQNRTRHRPRCRSSQMFDPPPCPLSPSWEYRERGMDNNSCDFLRIVMSIRNEDGNAYIPVRKHSRHSKRRYFLSD